MTSGRERGTAKYEPAAHGGSPRLSRPRGQCTVIVAWPVFPSLVARRNALPALRGRTIAMGFVPPWNWMTNTELSVLNQDTGRPLSSVPAESRSSAVKYTLSPTTRLALAGCRVTLATGAPGDPSTWIVIASLSAPLVAVIVANPSSWPVTAAVSVPDDDTDAIAGLSLVHVTDGFETGAPVASPTAACSRIAPPMPTDVGPEIRMYAPPEPARGSATERAVVPPVLTVTAGVTTGSSHA